MGASTLRRPLPRSDLARRLWRRVARLNEEWSALGPAVFAGIALSLLVYNHVESRVTDLVFWLGLALIATVFTWMLQNNHAASRIDAVTGLPNRLKLRDDLREALGSRDEQWTLVLLGLEGLEIAQDQLGYEAGDEKLRAFAQDVRENVEELGGTAYRVVGAQVCALLPTLGRETGELVMAIVGAVDRDSGGDGSAFRPHGAVSLPDDASDPDVALRLAAERLAAHKQRQGRSTKRQAHDALVAVLRSRSPELQEHLRTVAFRAISIGRLLGLDQDELDDVVSAARLQNIGLLSVPDAVLDKDGGLTRAESALIREHPIAGARIIGAAPALAPVAALVRASCEHYDGGGYPDGIAGDAIPLGARIVAVCVAFTALTNQRPHRPAQSPAEALAVLRECAGAQFDPQVIEALAKDLSDEVPPPNRPRRNGEMSEAELALASR
jgi:two-component system cell cycle response regulator